MTAHPLDIATATDRARERLRHHVARDLAARRSINAVVGSAVDDRSALGASELASQTTKYVRHTQW